ncbi:sensor histidine kinase [Phenylobacterium sp.]|uniref:sensor histidine kinase n=1 Tax=Phenylobacterium sp. TaxID=1871053 RepID=UPI0025F67C7A|nr:histidine kinase [Phenylobacterium sp.]
MLVGVEPFHLVGYKLILYGLSAVITFGMSVLLFRARGMSFLQKAVACTLLAVGGAPLFAVIDYAIGVICLYPKPLAYDPLNFGYAMIYGGAAFLGWSCLFVAMLYSFEVVDRERRLAAVREEALAAQMRALRYQVNPHFLFNTLNSIGGLIEEGAGGRAERMLLSLSTFLRATLALDPMQDVSLSQEMALQTEYLDVERERFSDRMSVKIDVPEEVREALVPSLILQPLVENAVKHGVGATVGPVEILLQARRIGERLHLSIENDMPVEGAQVARPGAGIGQRNVAERIDARFQGAARFDAGRGGPGRYRASLELPLRFA